MSAGAITDRQARAAETGMWLFLASLVMFFGSLYSGYVLLRAGSAEWTTPWRGWRHPWELLPGSWNQTLLLGLVVAQVSRARIGFPREWGRPGRFVPFVVAALSVTSALDWVMSAAALRRAGVGPASSVAAGTWFVLTGTVTALVVAGAVATAWVGWQHRTRTTPSHVARNLERYWWVMLAFQLAVVIGLDVL